MKNFPEEYRAHIIDKKCPAGKCKKLITYVINRTSASVAEPVPQVPGRSHCRRRSGKACDRSEGMYPLWRLP
jgi:hypothetical protein